MRLIAVSSVILLIAGCDPAYHLSYAVVNESDRPVYCVDLNKSAAAGAVMKIESDSSVLVYEEAGFGSGKVQFRQSREQVARRFIFYSDSSLNDSSAFIPARAWKYYPLPIGDYNARIYISNKDLHQ